VLGLLEGSDEKLRREVIVIGAHYDHVGFGTRKNSRGPVGRIHNGADDNASGTSAMMELAEAFSMLAEPPKRSVLFIGFDAEEKGLLGSQHWCKHPTIDRERLVAMINMDMVGRLRDDRLKVFGSRTATGLRRLISRQNDDLARASRNETEHFSTSRHVTQDFSGNSLKLVFTWEMKARADHYPFFKRNVPTLMFHTGLHDVYHTPRDDAKLINNPGLRKVTRLVFQVAYELAQREEIPGFRKQASGENEALRKSFNKPPPKMPGRLGVGWNSRTPPGNGLLLTAVSANSAAGKAGLRKGDRILKFAGRQIDDGEQLRTAVLAAANPVEAIVERSLGDEPLTLNYRASRFAWVSPGVWIRPSRVQSYSHAWCPVHQPPRPDCDSVIESIACKVESSPTKRGSSNCSTRKTTRSCCTSNATAGYSPCGCISTQRHRAARRDGSG
jgi:hypothetical protein